MSKLTSVLLCVCVVVSCFGVANSLSAFKTYTLEQKVSELLVPDSISNEDFSGELEYWSGLAAEVHEKLLRSFEKFKVYALYEALAWLFLSVILLVALFIEVFRSRSLRRSG
ncbi:hypothetical protein [Wenzhouxiangella sp. EGI_FJ10409]|uniref:hypothetical protein n=1 Tax=Wenzhouxiangella sp. EGI_FJ10409 TaxID=3243767 RepID=UPI0035E28677